MPFQRVEGRELHAVVYAPDAGDGSAVLMLHGLGSCGEDWLPQLPSLRPNYRLILPDLRGHGKSPVSSGWPRIPDYAADVASLLETLDHAPVHVVGLSLGGAVALQLSVDHPERVLSLLLVNAFARLRPSPRRTLRGAVRLALLGLGRMDVLGRWVASGLFPSEDQAEMRRLVAARLKETSRRGYAQAIYAITRFDLRARLSAIQAPTLVVAGEEDTTVPLKAKVELAAGIPGARMVRIEGSGHATPIDAIERFNRVMLEFLEGESVGGSAMATRSEGSV